MKRRKLPRNISRGNLIFYAVLVIVVLSLSIVFVAFRDEIDSRTLDRFLELLRFKKGSEAAEELSYDAGMGNLFALYGEQLAVLSPARLAVYDRSGEEVFSRSVGYENPALYTAGEKLLVFDRQNPYGMILRGGELIAETDFRILTAAGNSRGQYVLVTEGGGFRGVARFYDEKDNALFQWNSSSYISAAGLSPSGTRMLVALPTQEGISLATELIFLEVGNTEPLGKAGLGDALALDAYYPDNSHVCILTESGVYFYTDDGAPLGEYRWDNELLLGFYPTDKALFLHVGAWTNKRYGRLICLGYEGDVYDEFSLNDAPDEICASGKVCAILQDGWMTELYFDGGSLVQRANWETDASGLLLQNEDTMLLLHSGQAIWRKNQ